jgi:transaldolase
MDHRESHSATLTTDRPLTAADLRVKVFADGADIEAIRSLCANPVIKGFTTNPSHMHKAGIRDYEGFARELLEVVPDRPISFEVFSDDPDDMARQARLIASWGENVFVKIPVTNTTGRRCDPLLQDLSSAGVKVNVTGLMTVAQVQRVAHCLQDAPSACVSVFAGRIADTGVDPIPIMRESLEALAGTNAELIWASPREILNLVQAHEIGCDIITVTHDLLKKLHLLGHDLDVFSLETVKMFHDDARSAGFRL